MLATLPRGGCLVPMSTTSATVAELTAAADAISAYRQRVADLALPHVGKERDDLRDGHLRSRAGAAGRRADAAAGHSGLAEA